MTWVENGPQWSPIERCLQSRSLLAGLTIQGLDVFAAIIAFSPPSMHMGAAEPIQYPIWEFPSYCWMIFAHWPPLWSSSGQEATPDESQAAALFQMLMEIVRRKTCLQPCTEHLHNLWLEPPEKTRSTSSLRQALLLV